MSRSTLGAALAVAALAALLVSAPLTLARFHDADTVAGTFSTAIVRPPTNLAGTGGATATLTWTPSTSTWASGYDVLRSATSGSGYGSVKTVAPVSANGTTDDPASGTWYYVLTTIFNNWTSVRSNEASVVIGSPPVTTALKDCASTAAVTVNAGDNDGYESNPGRACALDGSTALDSNSGSSSSSNSCTANTKDKHRFWGYTFGLPATVTSINGITAKPTVSQNSNGGTAWLCIQLSSDNGATWTTPQSVVLSGNSLSTYTLGGPTDTWGRPWVLADLGAAFQVRVIDTSTQGTKDFRLDALQLSVTYTP